MTHIYIYIYIYIYSQHESKRSARLYDNVQSKKSFIMSLTDRSKQRLSSTKDTAILTLQYIRKIKLYSLTARNVQPYNETIYSTYMGNQIRRGETPTNSHHMDNLSKITYKNLFKKPHQAESIRHPRSSPMETKSQLNLPTYKSYIS